MARQEEWIQLHHSMLSMKSYQKNNKKKKKKDQNRDTKQLKMGGVRTQNKA